MREKLIEMIRKADKEDHESLTQDVHYAFMADNLIANGVTIPVRRKDCRYSDVFKCGRYCDCIESYVTDDGFCSDGERRTDA